MSRVSKSINRTVPASYFKTFRIWYLEGRAAWLLVRGHNLILVLVCGHNLLLAPPPAVHANIASASSADPQAFNLSTSTAGALSATACAALTSSGEPLSSMAPTHLPSETQNAASLGAKSPTVTTSPF